MSKYEYEYTGGVQSNFENERFPSAAKFISSYMPDRRSRVLDIGCSNGGMLNSLKALGYANLTGIDPSRQCVKYASDNLNIKTFQGNLFNSHMCLPKADLIILGAVLEHIRDLRHAITLLKGGYLSCSGLVYIEVPDVTGFGVQDDAPFQEFSIEHINYFSPTSLINLFKVFGFHCIALEQHYQKHGESTVSKVLTGLFRSTDAKFSWIKDLETASSLLSYVSYSRRIELQIRSVVDPLAQSQSPILVWGVGTHTQRLLATSSLRQANVVAYIDSNPRYQGKELDGVPIIAPEALPAMAALPILISSRFFQKEIEARIRQDLKLPNPVILLYHL